MERPKRGVGPKACRIFYLGHIVLTSWLIETFDFFFFNSFTVIRVLVCQCDQRHDVSNLHFVVYRGYCS